MSTLYDLTPEGFREQVLHVCGRTINLTAGDLAKVVPLGKRRIQDLTYAGEIVPQSRKKPCLYHWQSLYDYLNRTGRLSPE